MRDRNARIARLSRTMALAFLAAASTAACAASSGAAAGSRTEKPPEMAREVVVRTKVDARGVVTITPDPAIVRTGQRLVIDSCCEALKVTWKKPVPGIPEPRCEGGECSLVAPAVKERTEVFYAVSGSCGGKAFEVDPRFIFIR
jgi:hypothetical protein